jgi:hypothetical protein
MTAKPAFALQGVSHCTRGRGIGRASSRGTRRRLHVRTDLLPEAMSELTPEQIAPTMANAGRGTRYKAELVAEDVFAASFYFKDPDGIVLEYCAWLSAWGQGRA